MCGEPFAEVLRIFATSVATAISPDGRRLINQESDGTISAWQLDGGGDMRRVNAGAAITSLAVPKRESWLAAGREDGSLEVFDTRTWTGREVLRLPGAIEGLEVSTDGRWCAVATSSLFSVIDTKTWKEEVRYAYPGKLSAVRFAPDQRFLLAVGNEGVHGYSAPGWQKKFEIADDTRVERVAFDDTGARIAVLTRRSGGGHDNGIHFTRVADVASGNVLGWRYGSGNSNITRESMLRLITERHTTETGGDTVLVTASEAWTPLPLEPPEEFASADRRWVAKIVDNRLQLSRPGRNVPISSWDQQSKITGVLFFPEAEPQWLVSAGNDGFLRLWPLNGSDLRSEACSRLKATLAPDAWATLAQSVATPTSTPICDSG
jgi:WD40 repeat protein